MTTPSEEIGPVIFAQTPADLAALSVAPLQNGQQALIKAMRTGGGIGPFTLQPAISILPDSVFVVPTLDDVLRQWVFTPITDQSQIMCMSAELDLTVSPQTIVLFPPLNYKCEVFLQGLSWNITQKDGTVTTGPTTQIGTDSAASNIGASTAQANLAAGSVNTRITVQGVTSTTYNLDLSANGYKLKITSPAVLGTATVFKAKLFYWAQLFNN